MGPFLTLILRFFFTSKKLPISCPFKLRKKWLSVPKIEARAEASRKNCSNFDF